MAKKRERKQERYLESEQERGSKASKNERERRGDTTGEGKRTVGEQERDKMTRNKQAGENESTGERERERESRIE